MTWVKSALISLHLAAARWVCDGGQLAGRVLESLLSSLCRGGLWTCLLLLAPSCTSSNLENPLFRFPTCSFCKSLTFKTLFSWILLNKSVPMCVFQLSSHPAPLCHPSPGEACWSLQVFCRWFDFGVSHHACCTPGWVAVGHNARLQLRCPELSIKSSEPSCQALD